MRVGCINTKNVQKKSEMEFMNELEAEVTEIRDNTVSAKTRTVYVSSNVNFIRWLLPFA